MRLCLLGGDPAQQRLPELFRLYGLADKIIHSRIQTLLTYRTYLLRTARRQAEQPEPIAL